MRIAVTGSIATDHLMTFPGRFTDQILPDQLAHISLSFLVDTLDIRNGGVGANIAYGLGLLGRRPALVGAVGRDFTEYGSLLRGAGVDTDSVHVSGTHHTARFMCTTDEDGNQLASFYTGAMAEARSIDLGATASRLGGLDLVLVGADDPEGMLRHTQVCRDLGIRRAADPSQQLARLDGDSIRDLVDGADHLFTNEYERALLLSKTGWSETDVLARVGTWITTLGPKGCRIDRAGQAVIESAAVPALAAVDPTGVGDAFRAGYVAATASGLESVQAARAGAVMATFALESVGTQTYVFTPERLHERLVAAYGPEAAGITPVLFDGAHR
ncbi:carbohydrate kinase family protein [Streptomyces sp. NPDC008163]|uniref:carbohydrate kinase family protein n=1 Tax=Streptomyces sp. NPDC008163 TaxID=3364818 RepID=UPI0036EEEB1D